VGGVAVGSIEMSQQTQDTILAAVRVVVEQRLQQMGFAVAALDAQQLESRFARASNSGLHYQIELGGIDCVYSLWSVTDAAQQQAIDTEMDRLRATSRRVTGGTTTIGTAVKLLTEVLAARVPAGDHLLPAMEKFIDTFWDHEAMRAVHVAVTARQA
jgi:hypothetical protein